VNVYPWVVVIHVVGVMLFFIAHGAAVFVAFRLRRERDPARVRALLDLSKGSVGVLPSIALAVGFLAGVAAGFMGGWWGQLWIWISLALLLAVALLMTPMAAMRLNRVRVATGQPVNLMSGAAIKGAADTEGDAEELDRLLDRWNPWPVATVGFGGFVTILALMLLKPF
jgi:hypothetical protein